MENKFLLLIVVLILVSVLFLTTNTNLVIAPHSSTCTVSADCYSIGYKCEGGFCVQPTESECTTAGGCWTSGWCSNPPCTTTTPTPGGGTTTTGPGTTTTGPGTTTTGPGTTTTGPGTTTTSQCSFSQLWGCYDQASCTNALGSWCGTYCSSSCPVCSSSQTWNCYTQTDCTTNGGYWCNNYCQSSACPVCSSSQPSNCYDSASCSTAGAQWCQSSTASTAPGTSSGWCSSSCPVCSSSQTWNCYDQTSCTGAGGYWCNNYCQSSACPVCSSSQPWNCYDSASCTTAGAQWCTYSTTTGTTAITSNGYCSSSCPTCSKDQAGNCYTETECKGVGGNWCNNYCSSYSCPKCEANNAWNCNTETECKTAGGYWCNNYCSSYSCPTCSKDQAWNCYTEKDCNKEGGNWCKTNYGSSYCQSSTCPTYTCSKLESWYCYTETECKNAGAFWCNNYCQSVECPVCSSSQTWNCYDSTSCSTAGGNWCESSAGTGYGWCSSYKCPRCEKSQTWNCNNQAECTSAGGNWCGTYCSESCPVCSKTQPWNCNDETSCKVAGAEWCGDIGSISYSAYTPSGYCTDKCPKCEAGKVWNCYTENTCKTVGGSWCGTYCSESCPLCSKDQPWNCKTKGECGSVEAQWCGSETGGWCSDYCPTCSKDQTWNCNDETSCKDKEGYWCNNYCSSYSCPTCSKDQAWNCYDSASCTTAGGSWCEKSYGNVKGSYSWCDSKECPTCKEGQTYNCYTQSECEIIGGNWCPGNYCTNYECPSICGDEICTSGEENYCTVDCPRSISCPDKIEININQKEFNPGDTLKLSIKVLDKDNAPLPYTELVISSTNFGEGGESSMTMDSNGEFRTESLVDEVAFSGELNFILTTKVPECTDISETLSFKINSKGYCGDKVCSEEESFDSCPWDCGEEYCPESRQCPYGDTASCTKSPRGCFCETCNLNPENLPPNCQQIKDSRTGMLTVSCEQICPPPPSNINRLKEVCTENGGNPVLRKDSRGCNYFDCGFTKDPNIYEGYDRCFSEAEINSIKNKCEKLGVPVKILSVGKNCEIAKCEQTDVSEKCPFIPLVERESIEAECKLRGLQVLENHDENGCSYLECGTSNECVKEPPETVHQDCNTNGGELVVKRDVNDCLVFTECIVRGDDKDVIVDIDEIPKTEELLSIVLKLESILVKMQEIKNEIERIGEYYKSINSNEYLRFESAAVSIDTMIEEIQNSKDNLKNLIEKDKVTISDVRNFLYDIEYTIEIGLKDVLWKLLSSERVVEEEAEIKNCESDYNCFDNAFRICEPATYKPEKDKGDRSIFIEIKGLDENGLCVLAAKVPEGEGPPFGATDIQPPYEMTCKTPKYILGVGAYEPVKTIFPYCEGSLADLIKKYVLTNKNEATNEISSIITASVIAFLDKNQGPVGCVGDLECIKLCNRKPVDCLSYIDNKLKLKSGPGGTRSIKEMETYCDNNKESCENWFFSRGVSMSTLELKKENAKYSTTSNVIRRY